MNWSDLDSLVGFVLLGCSGKPHRFLDTEAGSGCATRSGDGFSRTGRFCTIVERVTQSLNPLPQFRILRAFCLESGYMYGTMAL